MGENDLLAEEFERHRARLRAVAYRMLGSISEAEDAVQESWLRLSRSRPDAIANPALCPTSRSGGLTARRGCLTFRSHR